MSDRERLIEWILECDKSNEVLNCFNERPRKRQAAEIIADYLLANGVIVPPCKVGSKVYKITRNKVKECEVVYVGISADEKCSHFNFVENYEDGKFYKAYSMVFEVIGKTVFLTREEAEKALAERRKHEQLH